MTLSIRHHTYFHGPNVWNRSSVTYCVIEAGTMIDAPWDAPDFAGWYTTLAAQVYWDASLEPRVIAENVSLGATVAQMALNLQRIAGVAVDFCFGRIRPNGDGQDVVVQHLHAGVGIAAVRLAVRWLTRLIDGTEDAFDLLEEFERFLTVVATNDHGAIGRCISNAAARRGIPQTRIDPRGRIMEFGNGRYRRRTLGTSTLRTSRVSVEIARDKYLTNCYLREAGLPVPESMVVRSCEQAVAAARAIGYPVAIKPIDLGASVGILLDLQSDDEVRTRFSIAADAAATSSGRLVVERFLSGSTYRVLIVNDRVVGVTQRIRPHVTGNGTHSIRHLIEIENTDPRRGTRQQDVYKKIVTDELIVHNLTQAGWSLDDVPDAGQRIELNPTGHRRMGAMDIDLTDTIHPANSDLLCTAVRVVGLDVAAIEVVAPEIAQPLWETGGAIIEINDSPAFTPNLFPVAGMVRDPGPAIMEMLFPSDQPVRVPVVAVSADATSRSICTLIASAATTDRRSVGMATRDGVFINGTHYCGVDGRNPTGPRTILNNPDVELAIVEVDAESIVDHGLGFDRCDIAVILSLSGKLTPFGEPVEVVLLRALDDDGRAILNGRDPGIRALAGMLDHTLGIIWIDVGETQMGDKNLISQAVVAAAEGLHLTDASIRACLKP